MRRGGVAIADSSAAKAARIVTVHQAHRTQLREPGVRVQPTAHPLQLALTLTRKAQMAQADPTLSGQSARAAVADAVGVRRVHLHQMQRKETNRIAAIAVSGLTAKSALKTKSVVTPRVCGHRILTTTTSAIASVR